jgi:mono/diheme cytochrome c family protein
VFPVLQTSVDTTQTKIDSGADAQLLADGQRLYQTACASCHGASGEGVSGLGNALTDSAFIHTQDDNALLQFIRMGRAADDPANQSGLAMPPNGGNPNLTDADLIAMISYLRHQH